jgi:5-formyltetrahydrofolate cyclo-ligase
MKHIIRDQIRSKRELLPSEEIEKNSKKIKDTLFSLNEYKKAKKILYYVSFGSEVNTHGMIEESLETKRVAVPKFEGDELKISRLRSFKDLHIGTYDILEPKKLRAIDEKKIDLIIVPGIAFDKTKHRIGFGHGHYDRLLKHFPKVNKIALAFSIQIVDKIPNDEWDVKVDKIITEKDIIQ